MTLSNVRTLLEIRNKLMNEENVTIHTSDKSPKLNEIPRSFHFSEDTDDEDNDFSVYEKKLILTEDRLDY